MKVTALALIFTVLLQVSQSQQNIPFSLDDTMTFLYASAAAYCGNTSWLQNWQCGSICNNLTGYTYYNSFTYEENLQPFQYIMIVNTQAQRFVTSFQGTTNPAQLVTEIMEATPVNYTLHDIESAQATGYFYNHYTQYLQAPFQQMLQAAVAQYPGFQFVFTGHSLGAALATLAGHDAILSGIVSQSNTLMYNYGSPRVANYYLAQNMDQTFGTVYRIVHQDDIVPHGPPCNLGGYNCSLQYPFSIGGITWSPWHLSNEIWFDAEYPTYMTCPLNLGEDPNCSDSVSILSGSISEHTTYFGLPVGSTCNNDNEGTSKKMFSVELVQDFASQYVASKFPDTVVEQLRKNMI